MSAPTPISTQNLINYYANLLVLQYISLPKAYSTIQALATLSVMDQLPLQVQNAYNMDGTAVGVQLDILGKYIGVTRTGYSVKGLPITLNDSDFFILIKMAVLTNNNNSTLASIQAAIAAIFPNELFVFDYKNMRISYLINSGIGNQNLIQLFITEGLLPKPLGVQLAAPIYSSQLKFFGMVDALTVQSYATQNFVSINAAANAVALANNISPFNDATNQITGVWLDATLGVSV